jgi:hypothetical protein
MKACMTQNIKYKPPVLVTLRLVDVKLTAKSEAEMQRVQSWISSPEFLSKLGNR